MRSPCGCADDPLGRRPDERVIRRPHLGDDAIERFRDVVGRVSSHVLTQGRAVDVASRSLLATGLFQPVTTPTPTPTPDPFATPTPSPFPSPTATPFPFLPVTEGIDISHWQGTIDWNGVAGAGKRFAYMKASEGTSYRDPTYPTNRDQAKALGLYVGAYHFAQPGRTPGDAVAEADFFLAVSQLAAGDLLPALDLEVTGGLGPLAPAA